MKSLTLIALSCTLVLVTLSSCSAFKTLYAGNNLDVGEKTEDGRLYTKTDVIVLRQGNEVIKEQRTFRLKPGAQITKIRAEDQVPNGYGGYASIISGGVGEDHVTLQFTSLPGHGMHFIIEIYTNY